LVSDVIGGGVMIHRTAAFLLAGACAASTASCDRSDQAGERAQRQQEIVHAMLSDVAAGEQRGADPATLAAKIAKAERTAATAQIDFNEAREEYRHKRRLDLSHLNREIVALDEEEKTSTSRRKAELTERLPVLHQMHATFREDLNRIETATPETWRQTKEGLEKEWRALEDAVHELT
jgi:hypothetical protein